MDAGYFYVNVKLREINAAGRDPFFKGVFFTKVCPEFVFEIGSNSFTIGYTE